MTTPTSYSRLLLLRSNNSMATNDPNAEEGPPEAVDDLAVEFGTTTAALTWTHPAGTTASVERQNVTASGSYTEIETGLTTGSFNDTGLTSDGNEYNYRVILENDFGPSGYSNVVNGVTDDVAEGPDYTPLYTDDFASRTVGASRSGWWASAVYANDHPGGVGKSLKIGRSAATPPTCGGSAFYGGRENLPIDIPIGNTIWYSQKRYHPANQTWGHCFAGGGDSGAASACGQDADGNQWIKDAVLAPVTGTSRIYIQPSGSRRSVTLNDGMRATAEVGSYSVTLTVTDGTLEDDRTKTVNLGASEDGSGFTARGFTARGFTARGFTARGF